MIEFFRSLPSPALIPFAITVFGIGAGMKVFLIAFVCIWPTLLNTVDGVRSLDPTMAESARMYRVSGWWKLRHVVLPNAMPQIFAGMRTSLSMAIILMVISEMAASTEGIGFLRASIPAIVRDRRYVGRHPPARLLGYVLNAAFTLVERGHSPGTGPRGAPTDRRSTMLHVTNLSKSFGSVHALQNVSFSVKANEFVCVVGPSGCGKTTLLRCMSGLLAPGGGGVSINGRRSRRRRRRSAWCSRTTAARSTPGAPSGQHHAAAPADGAEPGGARRTGLARPSRKSGSSASATITPGSSRAACSSAWPSRAPWPIGPRCS